mgnify:CR=1 FL=1
MKLFKDKSEEFFRWVKGTELVELDDIDVSEDPVRPELTLGWRISNGRKIFGLKYENEIEGIICIALKKCKNRYFIPALAGCSLPVVEFHYPCVVQP